MITSVSPSTLASADSGCQIMGLPATGKRGFGPACQRACPERATCRYSQSSESGLMRVPLEGPPTRMTPFVTAMLIC